MKLLVTLINIGFLLILMYKSQNWTSLCLRLTKILGCYRLNAKTKIKVGSPKIEVQYQKCQLLHLN